MTSPIVSVLLCVYNDAKFFRAAIESILSQSFNDLEFIIVNDASTDTSEDIILSYSDDRIRYFKNDINLGLTKSLNVGLKHAKGKYIVRQDADDISLNQRVQLQVDYMEQHPEVGLCGTFIKLIGDKDTIVRYKTNNDALKTELLYRCPLAHPSTIIRKKVLDDFDLNYDETFRVAQDYKLWAELAKVTQMATLPQVLLHYRWHSGQTTSKNAEEQKANSERVIRNLFGNLGFKASGDEIQSFIDIMSNDYQLSLKLIKNVGKIFGSIISCNQKTGFINPEYLESVLLDKWKRLTFGSTRLGLNFWLYFNASKLSRLCNVPTSLKTKMLIKSLIRI